MEQMETSDFDRVEMPTVLLVDDNKDLLWLMSNFLKRGGFVVQTFDHAPTLDQIQEFAPVVVFLDIQIGKQNGLETCTRIKEDPNLAHLPVVLVSSHAKEFLKEEAKMCGADGYLQKPVEPGVLIQLANHYAEQRNAA